MAVKQVAVLNIAERVEVTQTQVGEADAAEGDKGNAI